MTPYFYLVLAAAIIYVIALILYTPAKWWKSWTGRILWGTLFTKTVAIWIILLSFRYGEYEWREFVRYVAYSLILANSLLVLFGISSALNLGRKHKRNVRAELEQLAEHAEDYRH